MPQFMLLCTVSPTVHNSSRVGRHACQVLSQTRWVWEYSTQSLRNSSRFRVVSDWNILHVCDADQRSITSESIGNSDGMGSSAMKVTFHWLNWCVLARRHRKRGGTNEPPVRVFAQTEISSWNPRVRRCAPFKFQISASNWRISDIIFPRSRIYRLRKHSNTIQFVVKQKEHRNRSIW